jgi:hypothetical protein
MLLARLEYTLRHRNWRGLETAPRSRRGRDYGEMVRQIFGAIELESFDGQPRDRVRSVHAGRPRSSNGAKRPADL